MRFNKFVVQSRHDVSQFHSLEYACKHAELNAPATVYRGEQVTRIEGRVVSLHAEDSAPIASYW